MQGENKFFVIFVILKNLLRVLVSRSGLIPP